MLAINLPCARFFVFLPRRASDGDAPDRPQAGAFRSRLGRARPRLEQALQGKARPRLHLHPLARPIDPRCLTPPRSWCLLPRNDKDGAGSESMTELVLVNHWAGYLSLVVFVSA